MSAAMSAPMTVSASTPGTAGTADRLVRLGRIVGPHGVRGAVRVKCFTGDPMDIAAYGPLLDATGRRRLELRVIAPAKGGVLAKIAGIADRDAAEALRGLDLHVPRRALPPSDDSEEFYHADLIGLAVEDADGRPLGRVVAVQDFGAGPLLEVRGDGRELLLPFTRDAVPVIDLPAGRVQVVPPAMVEGGDAEAEAAT